LAETHVTIIKVYKTSVNTQNSEWKKWCKCRL